MAQSWIPSHTALARHPKTRKLARELGLPIPAVMGHLHCLWHWAFEIAPDGDLSRFDVQDIAEAAMYDPSEYESRFNDEYHVPEPGSPEKFVKALVDSGFADQHNTTLILHDWDEYGGKARGESGRSTRSAVLGNHIRWHVRRGEVAPDCPLCSGGVAPESPPIAPESHLSQTRQDKKRQEETRQEEKNSLSSSSITREKGDPDSETDDDAEGSTLYLKVKTELLKSFEEEDARAALTVWWPRQSTGEKFTSPLSFCSKVAQDFENKRVTFHPEDKLVIVVIEGEEFRFDREDGHWHRVEAEVVAS